MLNIPFRLGPPEPFHVWTFDKGMELWKHDLNNWGKKWTILPELKPSPALCLLTHSTDIEPDQENDSPFGEEESEKELSSSTDIKARLWSPKIRAKIGIRCLTLTYSIHLGEEESVDMQPTFALLQRREGFLLN